MYDKEFRKKRYSTEDAQIIIAKLRQYSFDDLHLLFSEGTIPSFEEVEGNTHGSFLAWNPKNPWWNELLIKLLFDNFSARWTGKKFITPFDENRKGKGVNLFQNRIFPHRYRFDTYFEKTRVDQKLGLALDYRHRFSPMFGLVDDVRKIEDGVFLGQMHYKYPWRKEPRFLGYFVLCPLS